ncbi:MAG: THUMP domain-containing protein [Thermoplasmata archaeon]
MALFMVRYGEIALKSPRVRNRFERALASNIASRFVGSSKECRIEHDRGRIFLWADDEDFATGVLSRTFGIVSFSKVEETTSRREDIFRLAVDISKPLFHNGIRFCIRARRSGQHDYTSMELARDAGSAVFLANEHLEPKVDLTNPELEIFIDVRHNRAYVYIGSIPGTGGMPLGTQGRVLGLVEKRQDTAACWLLMKRGCRVIVATGEPALAKPLEAWDPELKIHILDESKNLALIAKKRRADGLCLGWNMEDFDRQSSEMAVLDIPVFYPLMGMGEDEIREMIGMIEGAAN